MIVGFSGFGFPKAHGAAFGLLAYQSTWLRVHYGPEFLCSLLDEQPMGFYPPDALVHDAQRRGIEVLAPDVNHSAVGCTVTADGAVRIGLGYVLGVRADEVAALVAERESGGPFASLGDLASRAGAGRPALETLAWSGACDALADGDRRRALWTLGIAAPAHKVGALGASPGRHAAARSAARRRSRAATPRGSPRRRPPGAPRRPRRRRGRGRSSRCRWSCPTRPALERLSSWEAMIADYATTGLTTGPHALGAAARPAARRGHGRKRRPARPAPRRPRASSRGIVVARQRPGTAKGIVFMLLEDEAGTINLVVPPAVYERDRTIVRTEPLVVAEGRLERHPAGGGADQRASSRACERSTAPSDRRGGQGLQPARRGRTGAPARAAGGGDFRAVAPAGPEFRLGSAPVTRRLPWL